MVTERRFRQEQAARRRLLRGAWVVERAVGDGKFRAVRRVGTLDAALGWLRDASGVAFQYDEEVLRRGHALLVADTEADRVWRLRLED